VLEDGTMRAGPDEWARRVARLFDDHEADAIIAERNFGGEMVRKVIQTQRRNLPVKLVTASRGKVVRAEPVAALYEQGKVSHMRPMPELEDQMVNMTGDGYVGMGSPDRVDALVWALTDLMLSGSDARTVNIRFAG
jgi:predicted phage terminase large subunit-like protein